VKLRPNAPVPLWTQSIATRRTMMKLGVAAVVDLRGSLLLWRQVPRPKISRSDRSLTSPAAHRVVRSHTAPSCPRRKHQSQTIAIFDNYMISNIFTALPTFRMAREDLQDLKLFS